MSSPVNDIQDCSALVIDPNPTSRSTMAAMLREFGVEPVVQTSRASEARLLLEQRSFDIVLCEQHFDHQPMGGQDLLDELRRTQLLPLSTVFIMVTGEATYARVAEAAESALDSYLLKPYTAAALGDRLALARRRKRILWPIFRAIEIGQHETAIALSQHRLQTEAEYGVYCGRIAAELLMRSGQHERAKALFTTIRDQRQLPWAGLGVARAEIDAGTPQQARRTLETLIRANGHFADAFDVLGRVLVEQGEFGNALASYRRASELTPASVMRMQKLGLVAFYQGEHAEASRHLERAMATGLSSKMFDHQSLVLLAMLRLDQADSRGLVRVVEQLGHVASKNPDSSRLRRMHAKGLALRTLAERQHDALRVHLQALVDELHAEDFDFEAAINLLALLTRVLRAGVDLPGLAEWTERLAQRFCVSKTGTELLCAATLGHEGLTASIRAGHAHITQLAENAVSQSIKGSPMQAVQTLLMHGESTLNAKLVELATLMLQRHRERIAMHDDMAAQARNIQQRYCAKGTRVNLSDTGRDAGALALRV
ncbi:MAG: response regulator [Leptothrix sp. (in: b-proteobacteria)]